MHKFPALTIFKNIYLIIGRIIIIFGLLFAIISGIGALFGAEIAGAFSGIIGGAVGSSPSSPSVDLNVRIGGALMAFGGTLLVTFIISSFYLILSEIILLFVRIEDHLEQMRNFDQQMAFLTNPDLAWEFDIPMPVDQGKWWIARASERALGWVFNQIPDEFQDQLRGEADDLSAEMLDEQLINRMRQENINIDREVLKHLASVPVPDAPPIREQRTAAPASSTPSKPAPTQHPPPEPVTPKSVDDELDELFNSSLDDDIDPFDNLPEPEPLHIPREYRVLKARIAQTTDVLATPGGEAFSQLKAGMSGKIAAQTPDGRWYKVNGKVRGQEGWLSAADVTLLDGDPDELEPV